MNGESFVSQLIAWKQELINEVIPHYQKGDSERGKLAFQRWEERFIGFLEKHTPKEVARFRQATTHIVWAVKRNESPYNHFMRSNGKICLAFIDDLINEAERDRLVFGESSSKSGSSVSAPISPPQQVAGNSDGSPSPTKFISIIIGGILAAIFIIGAISDAFGAWSGIQTTVRGFFPTADVTTSAAMTPGGDNALGGMSETITPPVEVTVAGQPSVTPENTSTSTASTPAPSQISQEQMCGDLRVGVKEVLLREQPSISARVVGAVQQDTSVQYICGSEQTITRMVWVQVLANTSGGAIIGWIPGQDVSYPPTCTDTSVTAHKVLVRDNPSASSGVIVNLGQGHPVSIVCNSDTNEGGIIWVRIKTVLDGGTIIVGWVPAMDVT